MNAALAQSSWDVVLADYTMPYFSGPEALRVLKRSGVDIPFIFVSGTIGEDTAVAAMKAGAHDYVLKHNLKRLVPAIEREIGAADARRQTAEILRQTREDLEHLVRERTEVLQKANEALQSEIAMRKHVEEQARRLREHESILYEVTKAVSSTLELPVILETLLAKIDDLLPYAATTVRLLDKETGELRPVAGRNIKESEWKTASAPESGRLSKTAFETKAPLLVLNAVTDRRTGDPEFFRKNGLISYLGIPLTAKGETLGVLAFYTKVPHEFRDDEIEFLSSVASQAALAIYHSKLHEQLKR
jgi:FixJ family two-component response regulator